MRSDLGRAVRRAMTANGVTRRRFVMGAAALPLAGCARAAPSEPVAVIGGGLAGLVAALTLSDAGVPAQVYEASSRLGGRVKTSVLGEGLLVEEGAEFIDAGHTEILSLCRRFNLPLFNRATTPLPESVPRTAYVFGGVGQNPDELARLLEPLTRAVEADLALLDEDEATHAPRIDALSAKAYLDAVPLDPRARWLAETTIRSEYGVEPEESSALQLIYSLPGVDSGDADGAEAFTLQGGNARLIEAIAEALPLPPRLSVPTAAVFPLNGSTVEVRPAAEFLPGNSFRHSAAVIALPPKALRRITIGGSPIRFAAQSLGHNEKLIAAFRGRPWRDTRAFGAEAISDRGFAVAWDATLRQPTDNAALTFFTGGGMGLGSTAEALFGLGAMGRELAAAATGETIRTAWAEAPFIGGAYASFGPGEMTHPDRVYWGQGREVIEGRIAFAGEHLSESHYGFMEGAAQTGRLAAEAVLRALNR